MKIALVVALGAVSILLALGLTWALGSDEHGCGGQLGSSFVQVACSDSALTPYFYCECDWTFVSMGYAPSLFCKVF